MQILTPNFATTIATHAAEARQGGSDKGGGNGSCLADSRENRTWTLRNKLLLNACRMRAELTFNSLANCQASGRCSSFPSLPLFPAILSLFISDGRWEYLSHSHGQLKVQIIFTVRADKSHFNSFNERLCDKGETKVKQSDIIKWTSCK